MGYVSLFRKNEIAFSEQLIGKIKSYNVREGAVQTSHATEAEDINEHWDIKLETKFDVKAVKRVNRHDDDTNENIHWVELKNVRGNVGWLYGEADYFAFETDDYWVIVEKLALQGFMKKKLKDRVYCEKPELYKLYRRKGRQDLVTLVKTIDLMVIAELTIEKND